MPEMQFKGRKKEVFRILFCRDRKTSGRNQRFSFLHFLQQNFLQLLPLRIPQVKIWLGFVVPGPDREFLLIFTQAGGKGFPFVSWTT
jgi:hypothetical protein